MTAFRATGIRNGLADEAINPGDLVLAGESLLAGTVTTVGAATWGGSAIATGIIYRSGSTGAYTDTTDTSTNILAAIAGNNPSGACVVPGSSFRLLVINSVAFALTLAFGTGVVKGSGTTNIAASLWREYLVTVLNASNPVYSNASTTNASPTVIFEDASNNAVIYGIGPESSRLITPGMTCTGTGIPVATTVLGVTMGQGGIAGVTLSANATATGNAILSFFPTIQIDGLRSGTA